MTDQSCLFCNIISGTIPAETVYQDDLVVAIKDVKPVAPVHQLLIPRRHVESAAELVESDAAMLGRLFSVAATLAGEAGVAERGYRLVTNIGVDGGQSIAHLHFHLLGGREFAWPPG
ncbi:MAG: histidine triad nucleotide-binding protein [Chloroflexota bacterium]